MEKLLIFSKRKLNSDPVKVIDSLVDKGYYWLTDCNSGNLLIGKKPGDEPYIPYRIQFPSGKILDEVEIYGSFKNLKKLGFSRKEIKLARLLDSAVNHEYTDKDRYKFNNLSFVNEKDRIETIKKYSEKPFYLEVA